MKSSKASSAHVALLRGINVGGKNKLPMQELAAMFTEAGCTEVSTYIQSGNVLCKATPSRAEELPARIAAQIAARFGYRIPVILRTAAELRALAGANPLLRAGADTAVLHVAFLADVPGADRVASLDPARSAPDAFEVRGREIFLRLPNGVARSKLTNAYFDSKLATTSTVRNWRTVLELIERSA